MPRTRHFDIHAIDDLARSQGGIVTYAQLKSLGMSSTSISHWTRTGGRWQRILPATYLVHRGTPTLQERLQAAQQYAGPTAIITGLAALHLHGLRNLPQDPDRLPVQLLIPHERHLRSTSFLTVERTHRLPNPMHIDGFAVAPLPRAVFDAGRRSASRQHIRSFTLEAVQRKKLSVVDLRAEITQGQRQWSAVIRDVVGDAAAGVRSVPEAELRDLVLASDLPQPIWNPRLETPGGDFIAEPDGYYDDLGIALEVDSRRHHFDDEGGYETTWRRHKRYTRLGIAAVRIMPVDIRDDPRSVLDAIAETRDACAGRVAPDVVVKPKDQNRPE